MKEIEGLASLWPQGASGASGASSVFVLECIRYKLIEGSLEAILPTKWTDGKAQPGRSRARNKLGRGESQKGEDKRWRR